MTLHLIRRPRKPTEKELASMQSVNSARIVAGPHKGMLASEVRYA